jgi:hypothetical protein
MPKKPEVLPALSRPQLVALAKEHDERLVQAVASFSSSVTEIGRELAIMRDESTQFYKFIRVPTQEFCDGFPSWRAYARYRVANLCDASLYDHIAAFSLTQGENPIPEKFVNSLGIKKSAQLARLEPAQRSQKVLAIAQQASASEVKRRVDEILAESKPEPQKERLTLLSRSLPQQTIDLIEEIERDGIWMDGIRDGDKTVPLRAKLWHAVWANFKANYQGELEAGAAYREEQEANADKDHQGWPNDPHGSALHDIPSADV